VAFNLTHPDELRSYLPTDYVWSDQYDWKIQIVGRPYSAATHQIIGTPNDNPPRFAAVYSDEDSKLAGAVTVNWSKALMTCRRLLAHGASGAEGIALVQTLVTPAVTR